MDIAITYGSTGISTAFNNKEWTGDITESKSTSSLLIKGSSTTSTAFHNFVSTDPIPYQTARISRKQFSYTFQVPTFKKFKDLFTVEAGAFTLLRNFSTSLTADALGVKFLVKEYCMNIEQNQPLSIIFSPEHSQSAKTYAFINGIEVIPIPSDLDYSHDDDDLGARVVGQKSRFYIDNSIVLEIMERLNFRWDPIPYPGMFGKWAIVPDEKIKDFTRKTSVDVGFGYLLGLHFCERGLQMAETRNSVFSVSINDMIAKTNVDIGVVSGIHLHRDYMVMVKGNKEDGRRDISISLQLNDELVSELFRGLEILKLSSHDNSLASPNPSPPRRSSKSATVLNLLSFFGHGNAIATGAVIIISLVNIITYNLRKIWEDNCTNSGYKPSDLTEKLYRPFLLTEIQSATENFNDALIIWEGQGAREFWTEVETLSKLQHTNIISLIGHCKKCQEMILLYEYAPNGTLADHLSGLSGDSDYHSSLSWKQRLRICTGVGRGLDYLHTGTDQGIIHYDIKASNILLDENLETKISDLGLAKARKRNRVQSYVSTNVKDYFRSHRLRRKSDTYAFGVVLLEVLCERPALDRRVEEDKQRILAIWAQDCISKGEIDQLVAPTYFGEEVASHRFDLATIAAATNYFSRPNKIGEGRFGQEVAVKRKASNSCQGFTEFKNEVLLLSKLQHPNLIKLLGDRIHREEWILVYEFMENKSLDAYLFEYTIHGIVLVKSNVFSFGVVVLEILHGRRSYSFCSPQECEDYSALDPLKRVWKMWNEGKALEFLDKSMKDEFLADEALRCIQVGLLCVQDLPGDRPTMQSVLGMLEGEVPSLPQPLPPRAYVKKETYSSSKMSTHINATNEVTITELECR
ncbi:receptor kinase At5g39000 [Olea europaea subsp. europaea]|uniref:non-specific serine/threonine protein kinase n=1 Tax=Olea europaea subsp. europaea TaxID=158383 RepID=A0A8S0PLX9_OLEEU|nr:receptor kinase At5g39000 [Olea europaea subsp. europaea]